MHSPLEAVVYVRDRLLTCPPTKVVYQGGVAFPKSAANRVKSVSYEKFTRTAREEKQTCVDP